MFIVVGGGGGGGGGQEYPRPSAVKLIWTSVSVCLTTSNLVLTTEFKT